MYLVIKYTFCQDYVDVGIICYLMVNRSKVDFLLN